MPDTRTTSGTAQLGRGTATPGTVLTVSDNPGYAEWVEGGSFNGGTITGPLEISTTDVVAPLIALNSDGWGIYVGTLGRVDITSDDATPLSVEGNGARFAVGNLLGVKFSGIHVAPLDNTLAAGEVALWFDQSNGAAKLKIKGKSANGTVVTGEVALA